MRDSYGNIVEEYKHHPQNEINVNGVKLNKISKVISIFSNKLLRLNPKSKTSLKSRIHNMSTNVVDEKVLFENHHF